MRYDHTDPETPRAKETAKVLLDHNWRDGLIGEPTYLRSLMILGYRLRDAQVELSLLKMERRAPSAEDKRLADSIRFIRDRRIS